MQAVVPVSPPEDPPRRLKVFELSAAGLLAGSVILHVVALIPRYYGAAGQGSLWSEPDQAAQYVLLAAGWGLVLAVALSGPARARLAAALAVGLAATEFGFRLSDLGEVFRYGSREAGPGLWLMTAAWVLGAVGAVLLVLLARASSTESRPSESDFNGSRPAGAATPDSLRPPAQPGSTDARSWARPAAAAAPWSEDGGSPAALVPGGGPSTPPPPDPASPTVPLVAPGAPTVPLAAPESPTVPLSAPDSEAEWGRRDSSTTPIPLAAVTSSVGSTGGDATESLAASSGGASLDGGSAPDGAFGARPTILVALLALATAGAFLPAWDHYTGTATSTGRTVSFNLGNAFSGPWQIVLGSVFVALVLVAIPILATRMRSRAAGAALVAGALIVLATQFTAAVVQVDHAVPPSIAGLSPAQANQLGLQLHMSLTGWFTFDLLAAFALFVAVMVLAHVREMPSQARSAEPWSPAPYAQPAPGLPPP
jgi:hypothetical protein